MKKLLLIVTFLLFCLFPTDLLAQVSKNHQLNGDSWKLMPLPSDWDYEITYDSDRSDSNFILMSTNNSRHVQLWFYRLNFTDSIEYADAIIKNRYKSTTSVISRLILTQDIFVNGNQGRKYEFWEEAHLIPESAKHVAYAPEEVFTYYRWVWVTTTGTHLYLFVFMGNLDNTGKDLALFLNTLEKVYIIQ